MAFSKPANCSAKPLHLLSAVCSLGLSITKIEEFFYIKVFKIYIIFVS